MIYTNFDIQEALKFGEITISPFNPDNLGSNSYDLTLFPELMVYKKLPYQELILDSRKQNETISFPIPEDGYTLQPNQLYLARTNETTYCAKSVPIIMGKSSLARLGLSIHQTAVFGDIGWKGTWTLEITVIHPIIVYPNIKIPSLHNILNSSSLGE